MSACLDRAFEMSDEERGAWLTSLRSEDPGLAAEVASLLEEHRALSREGFLEDVALKPPTQASLEGQKIGAWTLVSPVGQGGMGSVWLARRSDGRFEGQAAVKLLNASLVGRTGEERFTREGTILARLTHPNIAHLVDAGVSPNGQPYLVLEYLPGAPIDRWCDEHALDVAGRLRLFLDVLAAVAHAHANLIVHRDIKPSNVLVGPGGQVKLLDFGIAKLLETEGGSGEATALTHEGGRALTPEYAAPEQVTGGTITTATDVYALGTLLFVLLAGRHPAAGSLGSTASLVRAIVDTDPPRLSDASPARLRGALKGDLDTIVAKALKKDPAQRYASVTAFADDLGRTLRNEPIGARPDTLAYRTTTFVRRHRQGVATAMAAVLLLAGLVGFYAARLAGERDRARSEAQKASKASELLAGLLTGADPYAPRLGPETTVRSLLDDVTERIEKELDRQPDLQVEMLTVAGRIYHRLDLDDKARPLLEKAVAIGRRTLGPQSERIAQSLTELGVLLRDDGNLAAAGPVLEEALAMRRKLLGPEHADVAVTLVELARVYADQGNDPRAEPLLRESLAIREKVLGKEDHETAVSLSDLAHVRRRKGDLAGAESLFSQALPIFRKTRGAEHPHVATILKYLGMISADREDYPASESLFRQSLAIDRKTLGDRHPDVASTLINLARPLLEEGKYEEAASVLQDGLRITRASLGNDHPLIAAGEIYMARVLLARKDPGAAERLLRDALRIRLRIFPPDDWRIGVPQSILGQALTHMGRYDEAEPLLRGAQRVLKSIPGEQGQEARANLSRLAVLRDVLAGRNQAAPHRVRSGRQ